LACWINTLVCTFILVFSIVVHLKGISSQLDLGVRIPDASNIRIAFHYAAIAHDIPFVHLGYDINAVDRMGYTTVFCAATHVCIPSFGQSDNLSVLRAYCEEGVDVTFYTRPTGDAKILYRFIMAGTECGTLKVLLKHGASLSRSLHAVVECGTPFPFFKMFLEASADIEEVWNNMTPLTRAASMKNPDTVQAFIDAGADINGGSGNLRPLFAAVNCTESCAVFELTTTAATIKFLCDAGIAWRNIRGRTGGIIFIVLYRCTCVVTIR
jgi:hypothetical protein